MTPNISSTTAARSAGLAKSVGLILGPFLAGLILLIGPPAATSAGDMADAWVVLALLILMAVWWVTEAIPIPITSLCPLVVLPLTGISDIKTVSAPYMHPIVILLMGGFLFAKAIEQWGLHERIALHIVARAGDHPTRMIAGFMAAGALLSMWISNSATTIMMIPIALSVAATVPDQKNKGDFAAALTLGIAYACSIGGLATPIGTPTNLIVIGYLNEAAGLDIGFLQWMALGLPVVCLLVPLAWLILTRLRFKMPGAGLRSAQAAVQARLIDLGAMKSPEKRTLTVFVLVGALWLFRRPLNELTLALGDAEIQPLAGLTDHMIAIIAVLLCFLIPAGSQEKPRERLLTWQAAERIPWGVLLLFGGGMSLAQAISGTGLNAYLGQSLAGVSAFPLFMVIVLITLVVLFATEVTSNIATASALMPVVGALALETGMPMEAMGLPVALAASCAFMLPMATGPNAVAYATGRFSIATMAKTGLMINAMAVFVISLIVYFLVPRIF